MMMPFEYALITVVPRADRGECINVGVVVWCQRAELLACAAHLDLARLSAFDPSLDQEQLQAALTAVQLVVRAEPAAGRIAHEPPGKRFRWLAAPRSTVLRLGAVHAGMTDDAAAEPARLLARLVR
jgi:hypothetical protein